MTLDAGAARIARHPQIDALIAAHAPVAIGVSGGKDSQAAALASFVYLDGVGHRGPRVLIHSDLGSVEWQESLPVCERLAAHLNTELIVVRRKAGDLMQRWEARWASSVRRYEQLETVTLVLPWSTPSMRFCTSELKTHVIAAELRRRFKGQTVINVTGVRREESAARARSTVASMDARGRMWHWRPICEWTLAQVLAQIAASGLALHPAYTDYSMSRVSCRFCIMAGLRDLTAAAAVPQSQDLYRGMVALEVVSTFAFQGSRWLGDVAPHLLSDELRAALTSAKQKAAARIELEKRIPADMLFVKGWPLRLPTHGEAHLLAEVRSDVCQLLNLQGRYLDAASIRERYDELMAAKHDDDDEEQNAAPEQGELLFA